MDSGKASEATLKAIVLNSGYIKVAKDILTDYESIPLNKRKNISGDPQRAGSETRNEILDQTRDQRNTERD